MIIYPVKSFLILLTIMVYGFTAYSQGSEPDPSNVTPDTHKSYKDTQKLINETQARLDLVRKQNNARAKEIEALTNKVGVIITKMSGQGKDNTALQSEISVLNELLSIERNITGDLRNKNTQLRRKLNALKIQNRTLTSQQGNIRKKNHAKITRLNERLRSAIVENSKKDRIINPLENNIEKLTAEVIRLKKQIKLLKENRYRSKLPLHSRSQ